MKVFIGATPLRPIESILPKICAIIGIIETRDELFGSSFAVFPLRLSAVQNSSRLCENSDAKLVNPVFVEFLPVLSHQKSANRKNSL
jgi:hypothetical protein